MLRFESLNILRKGEINKSEDTLNVNGHNSALALILWSHS